MVDRYGKNDTWDNRSIATRTVFNFITFTICDHGNIVIEITISDD